MFTNPKYGTSPASLTRDSYLATLGSLHEAPSEAESETDSLLGTEDQSQSLVSPSGSFQDLPDLPSVQSFQRPRSPSPSPPLASDVFAAENTSLISAEPPPGTTSQPTSALSVAPWRTEVRILSSYTWPIFGTHILEFSLMIVTVISVGHLGTVELASASLASMTANVVALSIIQGFAAALDALCPQSWTSSHPKRTSLHALRSAVLLVVIFIPQAIILWNSEHILLLLRQEPAVAYNASRYLRVIIFGIPAYGFFECARRYLQAQGLMLIPTIAVCITAPLNVLLNFLLVWGPPSVRLGFIGAPIATSASMNLMFLFTILYTVFYAPRTAWCGWSMDIFKDLKNNISLGIAGVFIVASEWWSWEIVALAASFLGPDALAAQSVLLTTSSLTYQLAYALSTAAAVRVGNLIGAQFTSIAKISAITSMFLGALVGLLNSLILVLARKHWGKLFSNEETVIANVGKILPLVALFQLADSLSCVTGGLIRGIGRSHAGAIINITSYYIIGIPIAFALTFSKLQMGLTGLWLGLTIALLYTALLTVVYLMRLDWNKVTESARERLAVDAAVSETQPLLSHHPRGRRSSSYASTSPSRRQRRRSSLPIP